jgi:hypothetical protein
VSEPTASLASSPPDDSQAAERLLTLVCDQLRKLAAQKFTREAPGQTLQATALVDEAWLLPGGDRQPVWQNRAHFFAAAAEAMRRILIDNARHKRSDRHGGRMERAPLTPESLELAAGMGVRRWPRWEARNHEGCIPKLWAVFPAEGRFGVRRQAAAFGRDDTSSSSKKRIFPGSPTTSGCADS